MLSADDTSASPLDQLAKLPARNRTSITLMLGTQTLNSFNDNFVKMLFISLAPTVAAGTRLGAEMQVYIGIIFSLPYILFAPLAGFLSDRYSKRSVVMWMQVAQIGIFAAFYAALAIRSPFWSLALGLGVFFFQATEAAIFSPAKMGIMKELAGSRRLGAVSGWLQMTMMAGVLGGMWAGGEAFGKTLKTSGDPWHAALLLMMAVGCFAIVQFVASMGVQATPQHPEVKFKRSMLWEHFAHLRLLFRDKPIRLAALGISFFWFISNSMLLILVIMATEAYPGNPVEAAKLRSIMPACLGVGVVFGSLFSAWVCKRRIELGLVPLAGLGLAFSLLCTGVASTHSAWIYVSLALLGFTGGCYMNPLYAYVQDRAAASERARILSGVNLMDCLAGLLATGVAWLYLQLGLSASTQVLTLVLPTLCAAAFITNLLPQQLIRFMFTGLLRSLYKVRTLNAERVPHTGGALLLPNHVSYVDALLLSVASERPVRFVMWETLYNVGWMNGFLRAFDTVPISATRAKDAIRTVAEALKEGQLICLFPEGQISRCGPMNELRKGFELMARQAGAPVVPVYMDGLWGSIASYYSGKLLSHWPKPVRYPVTVCFGEPIEAKEAKSAKVREAVHALASQAFLARKQFDLCADLKAQANMMRIDHVALIRRKDTVLVLGGHDSSIARAVALLPEVEVAHTLAEAAMILTDGGTLVAIGNTAQLAELALRPDWKRLGRLALCWQNEASVTLPVMGTPVLRGWWHEATDTLISTEFPDTPIPGFDSQLGLLPGSLGRLLPGIAYHQEATGLRLTGLLPNSATEIWLEHGVLDEAGFVVLA